jgi:hypothetical protein
MTCTRVHPVNVCHTRINIKVHIKNVHTYIQFLHSCKTMPVALASTPLRRLCLLLWSCFHLFLHHHHGHTHALVFSPRSSTFGITSWAQVLLPTNEVTFFLTVNPAIVASDGSGGFDGSVRTKVLVPLGHGFVHRPFTGKSMVEPHCVTGTNVHGIRTIVRGQRCGSGTDVGPLRGVITVVREMKLPTAVLVCGAVPQGPRRGSLGILVACWALVRDLNRHEESL